MMTTEAMTISSQDGLELYVRHWPLDHAKRVVCIIHGLGEHGGRYAEFAEKLNKHENAVFSLDCRGHGKSQGKKGHARSYQLLLSDVEELLKAARSEYTDLPIILFGHSMGGNIVASYAHEMNTNEISGFVLSAPWLKLAFDPPKWKVQMGNLLRSILPGIQLSNELDPQNLSKDAIEVSKYIEDELIHDKLTPGLYFLIQEAGLKNLSSTEKISKPVFCYHGTQDNITSLRATRQFADGLSDGTWWAVENGYHEPHHDEERQQVFEKVINWIETKIKN